MFLSSTMIFCRKILGSNHLRKRYCGCRCLFPRKLTSGPTKEERLSHYSFWKEKYRSQDGSTFDWFLDSKQLFENIEVHLEDLNNKNFHNTLCYLELGCGISELPLFVYKQSLFPLYIFVMDYIKEAVHQQNTTARNVVPENKESMFQAVCGDVMRLPFKDDTFDIAVDKGTMDALLKNRALGQLNSSRMVSQVIRSLKPGGRFIQVSDEDPDTRLEFLDKASGWKEKPETIMCNTDEDLFCEIGGNRFSGRQNDTISLVNKKGKTKGDESSSAENITVNTPELINQGRLSKQKDLSDVNRNNDVNNTWTFKIITDEHWNKEYFIYCLEKKISL